MPELRFFIEGFEPVAHALTPTLRMKLRAVNASPEPVHAIWLRCQLQIEPARRRYTAAEADHLFPLFTAPDRWDQTLRPFLWQHVVTMISGFTGTTVSDVLLPCSLDFSLAATQYCQSLADGAVPINAQFSGIVLIQAASGLEAVPIPWDLEARYAMPVAAWKAAIRTLYPGDPRPTAQRRGVGAPAAELCGREERAALRGAPAPSEAGSPRPITEAAA